MGYFLALLNAFEMTKRLSILQWWGNWEGLPEFDYNVWLLGLQWLHCRTVIAFILPLRAMTALLQRDWYTSAHASRKCHKSYLYWFNHILPETSPPFLFCKHGNDNFCVCVCICGSLFSLCQYFLFVKIQFRKAGQTWQKNLIYSFIFAFVNIISRSWMSKYFCSSVRFVQESANFEIWCLNDWWIFWQTDSWEFQK